MAILASRPDFSDIKFQRPGGSCRVIRLFFLAVSVVLVIGQSAVLASASPDAFLSEILAKDFEGDGVFRRGHIVYSHSKVQRSTDCDCREPTEVFDPKTDRIVIVSEWNLFEINMQSSDRSTIGVRFRIVAETVGEGSQRTLKPLTTPRDELIKYHLRQRSHEWFVLDPPLPRVGIDGLIFKIRADAADLRSTIDRLERNPTFNSKTAGPRAALEDDTRQLVVLEKIRSPTESERRR